MWHAIPAMNALGLGGGRAPLLASGYAWAVGVVKGIIGRQWAVRAVGSWQLVEPHAARRRDDMIMRSDWCARARFVLLPNGK